MTSRRAASRSRAPLLGVLLLALLALALPGRAQKLPPAPDQYVTDQAGVLDPATIARLNSQLDQVEKDTSNQIVVAIYANLPPGAEIAQYATQIYNAWGIGRKQQSNGVLFLIAIQDRKMFIATGRGLEGALPDATCKNIISLVITPRFRQGNYPGGIQAGINAIIAATKGEYKGTGTTVDGQQGGQHEIPGWVVIVAFIIFFLLSVFVFPRFGGGPFIFTGGGFGGGGDGGGFGGGGGFSGGGGSSAGGGAGGSW